MPNPDPTSSMVFGFNMSVLWYNFDIVNSMGRIQSHERVNPVGSSEHILRRDSWDLRVAYLKSIPLIGTGVDR